MSRAPIGLYVHHVGSGHRQRALVLGRALTAAGYDVTGLSSLAAPAGWPGAWVELERDDLPKAGEGADPSAGGVLHWAPLHHPGLAARHARLTAWLAEVHPALVYVDVSQEIAVVCRLSGVPVVSAVLPGVRDDAAHALGLRLSTAVVGWWPSAAVGMSAGLPPDVADRLRPLGACGRYAPDDSPRTIAGPGPGPVVVLAGSGGGGADLAALALAASGGDDDRRDWTVLAPGTWVEDPWTLLRSARVVVTHGGQNALAEVAAARVPAVVVPQARPHDEQVATAAVLGGPDWPVEVLGPEAGPADLCDAVGRAARLDGARWSGWLDGGAAGRFVELVGALVADSASESASRSGRAVG